MKILIVSTNIGTYNAVYYPHGIGSLAACAEEAGHQVSIWMPQSREELSRAGEVFTEYENGYVAFGFSTHQWRYIRTLAKAAKEAGATTIAGGPHATFAHNEVISDPAIDLVVQGEGEGALLDLLNRRAPEDTSNLVTKDFTNPVRPLIEDLDSLPTSDRTAFPMERILAENGREATIMAGRGCPWPCTYCCNSGWRSLYRGGGQYVRMRSVENVLAEVDMLASRYRFESLYFEDDIFNLNRDWATRFCAEYKRRFTFGFRVYLRIGRVSFDELVMLRDAGCRTVNVGVESGSETVRKRTLKRDIPDAQIAEFFDWCRELDLITRAFFMIGLPGEKAEQVDETIDCCRRIAPDQVQVSLFHPYPGTELYDRCKTDGLLSEREVDTYFDAETVLNISDGEKATIRERYERFCEIGRQVEATAAKARFNRSPSVRKSLLGEIENAVIEREGAEPVAIRPVRIGLKERFSIFAHPHSSIVFPKQQIDGGRFVAELALDPVCLEWGGKEVRFALAIENGDGEKLLAETTIDPKMIEADRGWNRWEVPLPEVGEADLILITSAGPNGDLTGAWALWGEPSVENRR
jgi:radical SAM superfamily enzyme YgiQ (UPF0313 family)